MPNPCTDTRQPASVEIIVDADDKEIYRSGVWRGAEARNTHISFNIPENTQTLTLRATVGGDNAHCDHFIFANGRLLHDELSIIEETVRNNATDVNNDGIVNTVDMVLVAVAYGERIIGNPKRNPDVNRDGVVNINDLTLVAKAIDKAYSAPTLLKPTETVLLPNYPNPFNPETWIPYQLATQSHVTITIYDTQGVSVRTLPVGFKSAGSYTDRTRAVYWDGCNDFGERISSGVYFYQLQTDDLSLMRKMVIVK